MLPLPGQTPSRFGSGEAAADDVNFQCCGQFTTIVISDPGRSPPTLMLLKLLLSVFLLAAAAAVAQEPVRYVVQFPEPHTHYLEVEASLPAGTPEVEVFMAVWTPGSYLVREYARHVEGFSAEAGGQALRWEKTSKNRWKIQAGGAPRIGLRYRVYANEMTVQGNFVDASFAMLNGAPNFVTLVGGEKRPYEVELRLPAVWKKSISGMKRKQGQPHTYVAADFDELLDCPIYAGNAPIHEFEVMGKRHYLVNEGEPPMWDGPASAQAVKQIVEGYAKMFRGLPYDFYVFFNIIQESGGGLEHKNSTWLGASRWAWANHQEPSDAPGAPRRPSRPGWLGLVSHEYFHLWNVKRFRPVELGPFDYERENYTRSLWVAEGITSYYDELMLARVGLIKPDAYLRALSREIRAVQLSPARLVQPLEEASFDSWIKLYRPHENLLNTNLSYYPRGAVVGFLLDMKLRKLTNGARSLDDVMRLGMERFSAEKGFTPQEFRQLASEVAGADLKQFFERALEQPVELDYAEALEWLGLRWKADPVKTGEKPPMDTGLATRTEGGRLVVATVRRGSAAWQAGVNVNDEILAVNEYRVRPEQWPSRLDFYKDASSVKLLFARRDQLKTVELPVVLEAPRTWTLEENPEAAPEQKARRQKWLGEIS